ncbi:hypothetical protein [Adlercreutzia aquisgranensis]|uniref:ATP-binding protein n=1 Tax=Adlercreutzia aquisgranensis TaxID=2941323 RepID=UPI00203C41AE|nr:hypothetical protein [Adlercreutzia aquisgranensis]
MELNQESVDMAGKRLLILGAVRPIDDVVKAAQEMGVYTIATDYYPDSPVKRIADMALDISTHDVDALTEEAVRLRVDGVFAACVDANLEPCRRLADNLGLPFYATAEQIAITCDKHLFKKACKRAGIPVVDEYSVEDLPSTPDELQRLLPLIIKPYDSAGSKGISVVRTADALDGAVEFARSFSPTGNVLAEPFIEGWDDSCLYLTIQDGVHSLSAMCDRIMEPCLTSGAPQPAELRFPSKHIDEYYRSLDGPIKALIRDLGIKNGTMFIQLFAKDGKFMAFESGFRTNGARNYVIESDANGINSLVMHIRHALGTGFSGWEAEECNDARFDSCYSIMAVNLRPGVIERIEGLDEIANADGFLDMAVYYERGDTVDQSVEGTLKQEFARIYFKAPSEDALDEIVEWARGTLRVVGADGELLNR